MRLNFHLIMSFFNKIERLYPLINKRSVRSHNRLRTFFLNNIILNADDDITPYINKKSVKAITNIPRMTPVIER